MKIFNNISLTELLNILFKIDTNIYINEQQLLIPFKNNIKKLYNSSHKHYILHMWSILTEQCPKSFYPNPEDTYKILFEPNDNYSCYLYLDDNNKILALGIFQDIEFNLLDKYINELPLLSSLTSIGIDINFNLLNKSKDVIIYKYIHSLLLVINNITTYKLLLNTLYTNVNYKKNRLVILTRYISCHPEDYYYNKEILEFNEDYHLKNYNNLELCYKIL
jgi:hypothetical protein